MIFSRVQNVLMHAPDSDNPRSAAGLTNLLVNLRIYVAILLLHAANSFCQNPSVLIAVEDDASPWSLNDGTGYANDVVTAAFKAVNTTVELRVMPYARCKRMAMKGEVVACFSMSPSPEFEGTIQLSDKPLFTCYADYFYNVSTLSTLSHEEDLPKGTVVGTVIGYEYPETFIKMAQEGRVVMEESPSESINLKKLALGRIEFALVTHNETKSEEWLTKSAGVAGKVKVAFRSGILKSYIGFSTKHPSGDWARKQFNKGYDLIAADGTLASIQKQWADKMKSALQSLGK